MNLKTIAKLAGVSTATVSYVINGNWAKVSQETIERVQKIIEENDYKPNATARSLASKKSKIIGVVVPHIDAWDNFFNNPHTAYILALLEKYIRSQGYYMMIRCVTRCRDVIPLFSSWNVDGFIFFGTLRSEVEDIREKLDVPAVFMDTYAEDMGISNIGIDDYEAGYLAARYLLNKGHRDIAFVGPSAEFVGAIQQRYAGFRRALEEQNIRMPPEYRITADTLHEQGERVGRQIAETTLPVTAVFCTSDILAFGVVKGLRSRGKRVPEDMSVMGFDNLPVNQMMSPSLTTVSQRAEEKAQKLGEALFQLIRKETTVVKETIRVEIVEGQSVRDLNLKME